MGNSHSMNESQHISRNARNMLNVRQPLNVSEHQTINFSRNDLIDTVSALDLNSVFELHGGAKNIDLHNIPSRNRYSEYTSTKTMKTNKMNGGANVVGAFSSASEGDLSLIKHMIMGRQTQTGGGCGTEGTEGPVTAVTESQNCGCDNNSVLQNGGFNFGQMLAASMINSELLSNTSSYNPLNSMSEQTIMNGGYLSELSNSQNSDLLTQSSAMFGGSFGTADLSTNSSYGLSQLNGGSYDNSYDNSMYSATSSYGMSQQQQMGGNLSATSSYGMSQQQMGGNLSATSSYGMSQQQMGGDLSMTSSYGMSQQQMGGDLSMTSSYGMSQQQMGGDLSMTSSYGMSQQQQQMGGDLSMTSSYGMSQQQMGGNLSATSSYGMSQNGGELSVTSALPIQYDSLFGGNKKDSKDSKKIKNSSSSSKSGSSSSSFNIDDINASSSSSKSPSDDDSDAVIARAIARNSTAMSDTTRELARISDNKTDKKRSRHSLNKSSTSSNTSSSSTSTNTSTGSSTSIDSSDSGSSISSSSTPGEAIGKVNSMRYNNLLLTSPNSATRSDSLVNAKQFYSSENGDLYSSESNFLRNNINRNRIR
jgi:hypothetical protein